MLFQWILMELLMLGSGFFALFVIIQLVVCWIYILANEYHTHCLYRLFEVLLYSCLSISHWQWVWVFLNYQIPTLCFLLSMTNAAVYWIVNCEIGVAQSAQFQHKDVCFTIWSHMAIKMQNVFWSRFSVISITVCCEAEILSALNYFLSPWNVNRNAPISLVISDYPTNS